MSNNVIRKATNRWTKGLVMDFSPENTKNEVLTHALNATLLTFNGNEMSLQNDMGNARVETAYLPEGYMPVGTCEYGGIIYIVSYNPLENKSLIGCFPSPERNISSDEIGKPQVHISREDFLEIDKETKQLTGVLKHNTQYVLLKDNNLNPGDKFLICSNHDIYNEKLENLLVKKDPKYNSEAAQDKDGYELVPNPILALNVVSIEESGKIVYLNSDIRRYDVPNIYDITKEVNGENQTESYKDIYKYHILGTGGNIDGKFNQQAIDIDSYRNALSSGYSVFKSKTSGKLAILAELIMIDSYSVTHSLKPCVDESGAPIDGKFDIILHHEVEPIITNENYNTAPKLRYYYLLKSLGYIQYCDSNNYIKTRTLFEEQDGVISLNVNNAFLNTQLSSIYELGESVNLNKTLKSECLFNFPYTNTYHGKMVAYNADTDSINESIYTKLTEGKYHRFDINQILDNTEYFLKNFKFYKYVDKEVGYTLVDKDHIISEEYTYYIQVPIYSYIDAQRSEDHRDKTLYKLTTSALVATETEIKNKLVEKFQYEEIHTYELATQEDIDSGKELWYTNNDPSDIKFISLTGSPIQGVLYYIRKIERNLKSIGFDINSDTITGLVYYYPTTKNYAEASEDDKIKYYDTETYPLEENPPYGSPITLYYQKTDYVYKPATQEQIENSSSSGIVLFYDSNYVPISDIKNYVGSELLFMVASVDTYLTYDQFKPNDDDNYIYGSKPDKKYPKDDPLYLFTLSNFIPEVPASDNLTSYHDLKLGTILLPELVYKHGIDLPFKYDYTIVPCMNYGRLDHLAVSNTVDFSKLHAFNRSGFTTWKYRIDDGYLRLTVGAEIFDTYETYKVDGLIFEFYDHRGFAGSLEFVDKKSYNGVFTKVIPLNSLQALSRKKITDEGQITSYKHNINIIEEYKDSGYTKNYFLNNNSVNYRNYKEGWEIDESDNDCGTIHSNIIYGIKAYIRRTTESGVEYIRKQDMFVYTLPIFNEYYYKIDNFMNISNPLLLFMLTYKLVDESIKVPYDSDYIKQGYNPNNKKQIDEYISGFYNISQNVTLDLIKYYKYSGTTNLYLEVGLKQDYNNISLAYNPELNKYFTCDLKLISDNDPKSTYNVVAESSELTDPKVILNYNQNGLDLNINKMVFASTNSADLHIEKGKLLSSNFIYNLGNNPIKINYDFIVGYTVNISNIRATNVPATTVCALCHKDSFGEYNYEDFGIYLQSVDSQTKYLSSQMVYNSGDKDNEIFGICRQINTNGNMEEQCQIQTSVETAAKEIKVAGKLNSGEPLRQTVSNLGKLTFCLPHVHGIYDTVGVNVYDRDVIYGSSNILPGFGVAPNTSGGFKVDGGFEVDDHDDTYGIRPTDHLYKKPLYNVVLNTKNSINYYSEFLSTFNYELILNKYNGWDYDEDSGDKVNNVYVEVMMRKFTGFTGDEVATFNEKLIETMKSVYAYNPDYDSLQINVGDVALQKYSPKFTSNIISLNSKFNFGEQNTLNNYIYISNINLTKYLEDLNEYSLDNLGNLVTVKKDKQFINHLQFTADYTYCGTDVAPYLINQLTYNTIVPIEIEEELTFNKSNLIVIKHHDNTNSFISGSLNKKLLYGYNADYKKLITLDVSNYEINTDGKLSMKDIGTLVFLKLAYTIELDKLADFVNDKFNSHNDVSNGPLSWEDGVTEAILTQVNLNMNLILYNVNYKKSNDGKGLYILINPSDITGLGLKSHNFAIIPSITVTGEKYDYSVYIDSITMLVGGCEILESILTKNNINLMNSNEDVLHSLIYKTENESLEFNTNTGKVKLKSDNVRYHKGGCSKVYIKLNNPNAILLGDYKEYDATSVLNIDLSNTSFSIHLTNSLDEPLGTVGLYYVNIERINYTVTRISKLANDEKDIITNRQTENYGKFTDNRYEVDSKFNSARIRGTSITLNDLYYEPNISGHRLYMKNDLCLFVNTHRGRIFYRSLDRNKDGNQWHKTYEHYNTLYMMTGPCFTTDNLKEDPT